jgi:hypothetical protein
MRVLPSKAVSLTLAAASLISLLLLLSWNITKSNFLRLIAPEGLPLGIEKTLFITRISGINSIVLRANDQVICDFSIGHGWVQDPLALKNILREVPEDLRKYLEHNRVEQVHSNLFETASVIGTMLVLQKDKLDTKESKRRIIIILTSA